MAPHAITFDSGLEDVKMGYQVFVPAILFTILIVLLTSARIGAKFWCQIKLGLDDYFILLALAFNIVGNFLELEAVKAGFGRHLQFLTKQQALMFTKFAQLGILFAIFALWAVKMSICFFILSLIRGTHKRLRWATYVLMAFNIIVTFVILLLWGLQARPIHRLWRPEVPGTTQSNEQVLTAMIVASCFHTVTDIFCALSPIYFLAKVQMSLKKKLIIGALTGSGLLVVAASIGRLGFLGDFRHPDRTWALRAEFIFSMSERNLACMVADLPALYMLARKLRKKLQILSSRGNSNSSNHSYALNPRRVETGLSSHKPPNTSYQSYSRKSTSRSSDHATAIDNEDFPYGNGASTFEDNVPLRNEPSQPERALMYDDNSITVQTDIIVQSQEGYYCRGNNDMGQSLCRFECTRKHSPRSKTRLLDT